MQSRLHKEGAESEQFWDILGGKSEYSSQKIERDNESDPHLFSCTFSNGKNMINPLSHSTGSREPGSKQKWLNIDLCTVLLSILPLTVFCSPFGGWMLNALQEIWRCLILTYFCCFNSYLRLDFAILPGDWISVFSFDLHTPLEYSISSYSYFKTT